MTASAVGSLTSLDTGQQFDISDDSSCLSATSLDLIRRLPRVRQLVLPVPCGWCRRPVIASRRDAVFCGRPCRQAAHRTKVEPSRADPSTGVARLAYADPPYPGKAWLYRGHPDYAGEVDHAELIARLMAMYDGWALSTSAESLPYVLGVVAEKSSDRKPLPNKVRVAAWFRGARPHQTARLVNAWEPVVYVPARPNRRADQVVPIHDALIGPTPRRRPTNPLDVIGAKPPEFCRWLFDLIGADPHDSFEDLYPGSGIVGRSWSWFTGSDPSRPARERGDVW